MPAPRIFPSPVTSALALSFFSSSLPPELPHPASDTTIIMLNNTLSTLFFITFSSILLVILYKYHKFFKFFFNFLYLDEGGHSLALMAKAQKKG